MGPFCRRRRRRKGNTSMGRRRRVGRRRRDGRTIAKADSDREKLRSWDGRTDDRHLVRGRRFFTTCQTPLITPISWTADYIVLAIDRPTRCDRRRVGIGQLKMKEKARTFAASWTLINLCEPLWTDNSTCTICVMYDIARSKRIKLSTFITIAYNQRLVYVLSVGLSTLINDVCGVALENNVSTLFTRHSRVPAIIWHECLATHAGKQRPFVCSRPLLLK